MENEERRGRGRNGVTWRFALQIVGALSLTTSALVVLAVLAIGAADSWRRWRIRRMFRREVIALLETERRLKGGDRQP